MGFTVSDTEDEQEQERQAANLQRLFERNAKANLKDDETPREGEDTFAWMQRTGRTQ